MEILQFIYEILTFEVRAPHQRSVVPAIVPFIPLITGGVSALTKGIMGGVALRRANKAAENLVEPGLEIPSAVKELALTKGTTESQKEFQEDVISDIITTSADVTRLDPTASGLGAFRAGLLTAGKVGGQFAEAEGKRTIDALTTVGQFQDAATQRELDLYKDEAAAIGAAKTAAQENIAGGFTDLMTGLEGSVKSEAFMEGKNGAFIKAEEGTPDVTPGKFSHEENPIDIVQDGEKIGEATGNEAIIAPGDVEEIQSFIDNEDKDGLMSFLSALFTRFKMQEQDRKQAKAEKGAMVPNKFKGFAKLPEKVQEKMDKDLAEKYGHGGMMMNKGGEKGMDGLLIVKL
tara:strand:+ start:15315 stop:16352 length:1038 start_codon:yes stop_codon:yes gene_type:complete